MAHLRHLHLRYCRTNGALTVNFHFVNTSFQTPDRTGQHDTTGYKNTQKIIRTHLQSVSDIKWVVVSAQSPKNTKDNTQPATVCSPCCHLTKDTEGSAAIPPDRVATTLHCVQYCFLHNVAFRNFMPYNWNSGTQISSYNPGVVNWPWHEPLNFFKMQDAIRFTWVSWVTL